MLSKIRFRLSELLIAVAVVAAALIWAERIAWRQMSSLRAEMTTETIAGFRSADVLRAAVLELHAAWRRGIGDPNSTSRAQIEANARKVRELIQGIAHKTDPSVERQLNDDLALAFDEYSSRLSRSFDTPRAQPDSAASRTAEQGVEAGLEQMLSLTEKLATANRAAAERFVIDANVALTRLQRFLFVALLGLLMSGIAVVFIAYRRMIAPLRSDLTESRATIERQEKLASLGVFATGIAHEIRNPLTAIKVRLFSLSSTHKPGTSEHEDLEVIRNEIDRLERIVRDFLQFARPSEPTLQTVHTANLLKDACDLLSSGLAKKSVTLKLDLERDELVRVDPDKMKQVLINFVQNAADSMETGGTIVLRSRLERKILNGRTVSAVVLDIADTGKGIPPEVQKRLFDPFFTTKEEGTGLGLPIAARIIEKHGGVIEYQTQPNRGTTFSIILPQAPKDEIES